MGPGKKIGKHTQFIVKKECIGIIRWDLEEKKFVGKGGYLKKGH